MNTAPLMLTAKDEDLLGASNRSDAMGVRAVWSVRGRRRLVEEAAWRADAWEAAPTGADRR